MVYDAVHAPVRNAHTVPWLLKKVVRRRMARKDGWLIKKMPHTINKMPMMEYLFMEVGINITVNKVAKSGDVPLAIG